MILPGQGTLSHHPLLAILAEANSALHARYSVAQDLSVLVTGEEFSSK
jgi:hypothetical protein